MLKDDRSISEFKSKGRLSRIANEFHYSIDGLKLA